MNRSLLERVDSLQAYPNITAAARILGVDASTLSRRKDLEVQQRGERDRVLSASEVMRLAVVYRKRSINEVAQELVEHARRNAPDDVERVEEEIEAFVDGLSTQSKPYDSFLAEARKRLPGKLYGEVEKAVTAGRGTRPAAIIGKVPR